MNEPACPAIDKTRPRRRGQKIKGHGLALNFLEDSTMTRKDVLTNIRIAGYHGDQRRFTRLLIENRISASAAGSAYRQGERHKQDGMKCACPFCARPAPVPAIKGYTSE